MRFLNFSNSFYALSVLFVIGFVQLPTSNGANILGMFTSYSPSHLIVHMSMVKALAEKGHNITVVSTMKPTITHPSIRHIIIPATEQQKKAVDQGLNKMAGERNSIFTTLSNMFTSMFTLISMQFEAMQDERFIKLYDEKFDLVILGYFLNDFQIGVASKFNCPLIINFSGPPMGLVDDFVGNPQQVSFVPNPFLLDKLGEPMNFINRLKNLLGNCFLSIFKFLINYQMEVYYKELFPSQNFPTYNDMKKNISLTFCNGHFSEGPIRANVPGIIEVGGIQIKDKPDSLPQDIAEFLDSAKENGAVLFSLGSNLKGSNVKPHIVKAIFNTLSSLKQKVIWKWEDFNNLPGKSPNILYKKWLPQDDILAHPNIRLFITHAGKGGVAEAQYHAVPMVALPVFGDQNGNAEKMVAAGFGINLDMLSLNQPDFKAAVLEVLENPKYKENIKQFSQLYRDRPISTKESVVYWTEYVLRHHGAKHMQSPLVYLNSIQSLSLDVIGAIVLAFYVICKIIKITSKFVTSKIKSKKQNEKKKSNKKVKKN